MRITLDRKLRTGIIARVTLALALVLPIAFGSADERDTESAAVAQARDNFDQGQWKSAILILVNRLDEAPGDLAATLLLGRSFLEVGEYSKAQRLFEKALVGGADPADVALGQIRALYYQGEYDKILLLFDPTSLSLTGDELAGAYLYRGRALKATGRRDDAVAAFRRVLRLKPGATEALEELASLAVAERDLATAQDYVDAAFAGAPSSAKAWELQGTIFHLNQRFTEAVDAYEKALATNPRRDTPLLWMGWSLVAQGKLDEAEQAVSRAHQHTPRDPVANYLRGVIAFQRGDYKNAESALNDVLVVLPSDTRAQLLLAVVYYNMGQYLRAANHLQLVQQAYPEMEMAYGLHARTELARGRGDGLTGEFDDTLQQVPSDPSVRLVLALAAIEAGELTKAFGYLRKVQGSQTHQAALQGLDKAIEQLQDGLPDRAAEIVSKALEAMPLVPSRVTVPDDRSGTLSLRQMVNRIDGLLHGGQYAEAMESIQQELLPALPGKALPYAYAGVVQAAQGQISAATTSYQRALQIEPSNVMALVALGKLEAAQGDYESAETRFRQALEKRPRSLAVAMELAELAFRRGQTALGVEWLEGAAISHPASLLPRLALSEYYLRQRDGRAAKDAVWPAYLLWPTNVEVLDKVGRAELLDKQYSAAADTFAVMAERIPESPYPYIQLGGAQLHSGRKRDAATSFQKAWEQDPHNLKVAVALTQARLSLKEFDKAFEIASVVDRGSPTSPLGPAMRGDIAMAQGNYALAAKAYDAALSRGENGALVRQLTRALLAAGGDQASTKTLQQWVTSHPDDIQSLLGLAQITDRLGDRSRSRAYYRQVLEMAPDNQQAITAIERLDQGRSPHSSVSDRGLSNVEATP